MMTLLQAWLGIELRRRWRSLLVLALLVAVASCTVLAALSGARRGYSAPDRLLDQSLPATIVLRPSDRFDLGLVRRLPGVVAVSGFNFYTGFGVDEAPDETVNRYIPADDEAMRTVERPAVLAGRLADPKRYDEAVVTPNFVATHGLGVGDQVTLRLFTANQVETGVSGVRATRPPVPLGPTVPVRIVGVVRSPWFSDSVGSRGQLIPSPGLGVQFSQYVHGRSPYLILNALVRLDGGAAAVPAFREALEKIPGAPTFEIVDRTDVVRHWREVTRFEGGCLLAFGLCVLLVGGALVAQAVSRSDLGALSDLLPLRAVGMERRQLLWLTGAAPTLAAALGALVGVAGAVVVSAWMPFGAAAHLEPAPGVWFDALVLVPGLLLVPALVYLGSVANVALLLLSSPQPGRTRHSPIARAVSRSRLGVPIQLGVRFALEPDNLRGAVVVRPAVFGAVAGMVGTGAAVIFAMGVADVAGNPERFGQPFDAMVGFGYGGNDLNPVEAVVGAVATEPAVVQISDARFAIAGTGEATVITFALQENAHDDLVLSEGVTPRGEGEVMLAPRAARRLGAEVGSTVRLDGQAGEGASFLVTGIGFVPETDYNGYDDGALLVRSDYDRLFGTFFVNHMALVTFADGEQPQVVLDRLARRIGTTGARYVYPSLVPQPKQLAEIRNVRLLPVALGAFLVLFAISAVAHALSKAVRHRQRELCVLRAVGMTPWQARGVLLTQATVLAAIGVVVGVPIGIALGRVVWRTVARFMPVTYVAPSALWVVVACVPIALIVANLLAARPGARAARLPLSQILRAE